MELVDMKRPPQGTSSGLAQPQSGNDYPWGLSMNLGEDEIKKLGFEDALPEAGSTLMMMARLKVNSVSHNQVDGGALDRRIGLQVTHMALGQDIKKQDNGATAQKLYTTGPGPDEASM